MKKLILILLLSINIFAYDDIERGNKAIKIFFYMDISQVDYH